MKTTLEKTESNTDKGLRVAIVGHTNTGKTSLIRTLLRDERFGKIEDASGTTRSVERTTIYADETEALVLFDTPGFEDSSALLEAIDAVDAEPASRSGAERLRQFIQTSPEHGEFDQELKILQQALTSDVLLYIVDVREPLLGKYADEVSILSLCGKPIVPVFNFIAGNQAALATWRDKMAEFNLHAALEFDTVAFDFEAEKRLYQKLQSLLEPHYEALQRLIDCRQKNWDTLCQAAAQRIFTLLREVIAYRRVIDKESAADTQQATDEMQAFVRKSEQRALKDLLRIFAFRQIDIELHQIPVQDGQWTMDVFSTDALKAFGLNASSSALTGAAAGASLDLMVGGLSLGTATVIGAALGAGVATARRYRQELNAALRGNKWMCVDDTTITLLFLRQRDLLHRLSRRGHAAQHTLEVGGGSKDEHTVPKGFSKTVDKIRRHPHWKESSDESDYQLTKQQVCSWLLEESTSLRTPK